jgi:hypothetical protein
MTDAHELCSGFTLDKWLEFLITPPSWEKPTPHSDDETDSPYENCLPKSLFDDNQPSSCPSFPQTQRENYFGNCVPSVFFPDFIGESECRLIQISNVDPQTTSEELEKTFSCFGDLELVDVSGVKLGTARVKYFDLQAAIRARQSRITLRGKTLMAMFGPPDHISNPRKPPNTGTIVIFHLKNGVSDDLLKVEFAKFGEIRQIRWAPARQTQRFIEYWDIRAAERALKAMKGRRVFDSKISVEYSLPGGYRKAQCTAPEPRLPTVERVSHGYSSRQSY